MVSYCETKKTAFLRRFFFIFISFAKKNMFEKRVLVKAVYYRFFEDSDKTFSQYFIEITKDKHENCYNFEISYEQFQKLLEHNAIERVLHSLTTLPTLNPAMPAYRYHSITVDLYRFKERF